MGKILINATHAEEIRVALIKDNVLQDLDIDRVTEIKRKGDIYKGVITRIEPSLEAVFVNYGAKRQGFLPFKEVNPEYYASIVDDSDKKLSITNLLKEGQELLVQVDKEERGNKGAALTTFITLAGCYLVLMPNNPESGGISRRIDGEDRDELKETLNSLTMPEDMSVIIRTAGVGKGVEDLQTDLNMLLNQWEAIKQAYETHLPPCLIHQEGDVIIRSIRDNLRAHLNEIIIDEHVAFVKVKQYISQIRPDFVSQVKLYNSHVPLFVQYGIEKQIETAYKREVTLPSGGAIVIDRTEALVAIDINSAKATTGSDIETTAFNTNLEAANEIARQLRLRDLGGLVVIDFIDMNNSKHQREVENQLKEALSVDRARIQTGRISRFGLLEMSRQRLRPSLGESAQETCPRCEGRGTVRNIPSHALSLIRLIEEEALKDKVAEIQVQLPVELATFVINEKREFIHDIEQRHKIHVLIIANPYMHMPDYTITKTKEDNLGKNKKPSYSLIQNPELEIVRLSDDAKQLSEPAVKVVAEVHPITKPPATSLIKRIWSSLFGSDEDTQKTVKKYHHSKPRGHQQDRRNNNNNRRRRGNNHNNQAHPNRNSAGSHQNKNAHQQNRRPNKPSGTSNKPDATEKKEQAQA